MPDLHYQRLLRPPTEGRAHFSCRRSAIAGGELVAVRGELDTGTVAPVDRALRRASASADVIVLDLRGLDFIGSSGAHLIGDADRRSAARAVD